MKSISTASIYSDMKMQLCRFFDNRDHYFPASNLSWYCICKCCLQCWAPYLTKVYVPTKWHHVFTLPAKELEAIFGQ